MKKCDVDYCFKEKQKRSKFCSMHGARLLRTGSLELKIISREKKFLDNINFTDNCWIWNGYKNSSGYGRYFYNGKYMLAHRLSYMLLKGELKNNLLVCHTCDNPSCVNPEHLWQGTNLDNSRDCKSKNRNYFKKGHKFSNKYSEEEILALKDIFKLKISVPKLAKTMKTTVHVIRHLKEYYGEELCKN